MADQHAAVVAPHGAGLQDGAAQAGLGAGEQARAGVHADGNNDAALRQLVNDLAQVLHDVGHAQSYRPKLRAFSGADGYSVEFFADFNKYAQELNLPPARQAANKHANTNKQAKQKTNKKPNT